MSTWAACPINPTSIISFFEGLTHHMILTNLNYKVYAGLYALLALFHVGLLSPPIKKGASIKNRLIISTVKPRFTIISVYHSSMVYRLIARNS
jgi:hypothetical protein